MAKLAIAVVLLVSVTASAQRYTRQQTVKIDVVVSDRSRPQPPKPAPAAQPITADKALKYEETRMTYSKDQEAILVKLIAATPDNDPDKPDLWFRLAELYARQQRIERLRAGGVQNEQARQSMLK